MNSLQSLVSYGQSIWLDYIRRNLLKGSGLQQLIENDGIRGITSNPSIFEKAIAGSTDYNDAIEALVDLSPKQAYEQLAVEDIQNAADILLPVYKVSEARDGYVSMEVSPRLAHDADATVLEARRLWNEVDRQNLMIKVPATPAGITAIETLIGEGININTTLLFSIDVYEKVAESYMRGLEHYAETTSDLSKIAGVASFFISRVDATIDRLLEDLRQNKPTQETLANIDQVQGKVAIANAKVAYQKYKTIFSGERWQALLAKGAQSQRLLWASTGTKNPAYSDVLYIDELIGQDTVNTVPPTTLDAFRDHGHASASLELRMDEAYEVVEIVKRLEISLSDVAEQLLVDGLELFVVAFDKLLSAVEEAQQQHHKSAISAQQSNLPAKLQARVDAKLDEWQNKGNVQRLWARDAWLWTGKDENRWLDWLDISSEQLENIGDLRRLIQFAEGQYFKQAVLLGMGGSSLAPDVLRETFGVTEGFPDWIILDSTDPAQVKAVDDKIDYERCLFLISSKSGSTLEPNILRDYFYSRAVATLGEKQAANHFGVVTDPGSNLEKKARAENYRKIFYGKPCIGGRYSALSNFGMVPAAAMGLDVTRLLERAEQMKEACAACVPARENPGVVLGVILGVAASRSCDKLTLVVSPAIKTLGAWLEQLIAESTGKLGKGIIPIDGEVLGQPEIYGTDRIFAYLRLKDAVDQDQEVSIVRLKQAGLPVIQIDVDSRYDLAQEFFRWEIATAVACSILDINAFDQPDVEASKLATRKLTTDYETNGALAEESPFIEDEHFKLFSDDSNIAQLRELSESDATAIDIMQAHIRRCGEGDYFALLAYLNRLDPAHQRHLQAIRQIVCDKLKVATCVGFGPRFLHSTGQAYKGGPNTGVFLQITCDDSQDIAVPGHQYSFGVVKAAQARGDFDVLVDRQRRALRVHLGKDTAAGLGKDTAAGLKKLQNIVEQAFT